MVDQSSPDSKSKRQKGGVRQRIISMISDRRQLKESERSRSEEREGAAGMRGGEVEGQENSQARTVKADSPRRLQKDPDMENSPRPATRQKSSMRHASVTIVTSKRDSILEEPAEVFSVNGEILLDNESTEGECVKVEHQLQTEATDREDMRTDKMEWEIHVEGEERNGIKLKGEAGELELEGTESGAGSDARIRIRARTGAFLETSSNDRSLLSTSPVLRHRQRLSEEDLVRPRRSLTYSSSWSKAIEDESDEICRTFAVVTETIGYILWHSVDVESDKPPWKV